MKFRLPLCNGGGKSEMLQKARLKSNLELAMSKIKKQTKKGKLAIEQMKYNIVRQLRKKQIQVARVEVECLISEQKTTAHDIIHIFCAQLHSRVTILCKQRTCPAGLKEAVCSLLYSTPRCLEIPQLGKLFGIFKKKYGEEFVSAAVDLRPDCAVNSTLIQKLSSRKPSPEEKLKLLHEIAKQNDVEWDAAEFETEGPVVDASRPAQAVESSSNSLGHAQTVESSSFSLGPAHAVDSSSGRLDFEDMASAAQRLAEQAAAAALAASKYIHQLHITSSRFHDISLSDSDTEYFSP